MRGTRFLGWFCFSRARVIVLPERTMTSVVPENSGSQKKAQVAPESTLSHHLTLSFNDAFGRPGIGMMISLFIAIVWTIWLVIVTINPNRAANYLMRTSEFDDGMLWLIVNADSALVITHAVSLCLVALGYLWVGARMTVLRNKERSKMSIMPFLGRRGLWAWLLESTSYTGPNGRIMNAINKGVDILVQTYSLHSLMDDGYSDSTCIAYATLIAINSLSCALFILTPETHSAFTEMFCDTMFDMVFAVGAPIELLVNAALQFDFDRNRAEMYLRYFSAGWFERETRLVSDAAEITAFRISFDGMRIQTWYGWAIRTTLNFSFYYRMLRLVEVSIESARDSQKRCANEPYDRRAIRRSRKVPRFCAVLYIAASFVILFYTTKSIKESQKVCSVYPQCVAYAHRWDSGGNCPCRAMIDVDRAPTTWEQWTNPADSMETVRSLAVSGDLRILQIINRQLLSLPEELKKCTSLQQLVLMYTGIERFPDWANMLQNLQLIAVEGQPGGRSLLYLPDDMFSKMGSLMYFHLGAHPSLPRLPSFEGLSTLKTISFAMFSHLNDLPDVAPLQAIERIVLVGSHNMYTLPDFSKNRFLVSLILADLGACCSGYFGGCKLPSMCEAQPIGKCMNASTERPTAVAQSVFDKYNASICTFPIPTDIYLAPILEENVRACNGVLYRRCRLASSSQYYANELGMCYSDRMMVIACMYSPPHEAIRREEISRGIGTPCDPVEEKWLGCNTTQTS